MVDERVKSELRTRWESAAPGWAKWEMVFAAGLTEVTDCLLDMAGTKPKTHNQWCPGPSSEGR